MKLSEAYNVTSQLYTHRATVPLREIGESGGGHFHSKYWGQPGNIDLNLFIDSLLVMTGRTVYTC